MDMESLTTAVPFKSLSKPELDLLIPLLDTQHIAHNTQIIRQDEQSPGMYILLSGSAKVYKELPSDILVNFALLNPGDSFAETPLLTHGTSIASVMSITDCEVILFKRELFHALLVTHPNMMSKIIHNIAHLESYRIRHRFDNIVSLLCDKEKMLSCRGLSVNVPDDDAIPRTTAFSPNMAQLQELDVFTLWDDEEIEALMSHGSLYDFQNKSVLYHQDEEANSFFIILFGAIQQIIEYQNVNTKLTVSGPGKIIGVISYLDEKPRASTAIIRERAVVLEMTRNQQHQFAKKHPELWNKLFFNVVVNQLQFLKMADLQIIRLGAETIDVLDAQRFDDIITTRRDQ